MWSWDLNQAAQPRATPWPSVSCREAVPGPRPHQAGAPGGRPLQALTSFWLQEQGDLPAWLRMSWVPGKALWSRCHLWVLLERVSSERWLCRPRLGLRGTEAYEPNGPQVPGPPMAGRALKGPGPGPAHCGQGDLWGEEGRPRQCTGTPPFPGASQAGAVPAGPGAGRGPLPVLGVQGVGQTLQPPPDAPKHGLQAVRRGGPPGRPVLVDALLDWRREGTMRALPGGALPTSAPPALPCSLHQAGRACHHGNPKLPLWLPPEDARSGSKTTSCDCFCLHYPIRAPHPLLLQPQTAPFSRGKPSRPTMDP